MYPNMMSLVRYYVCFQNETRFLRLLLKVCLCLYGSGDFRKPLTRLAFDVRLAKRLRRPEKQYQSISTWVFAWDLNLSDKYPLYRDAVFEFLFKE